MIFRIGNHEVTFTPHPMDRTIFLADAGGFRCEITSGSFGVEASISDASDEEAETLGRAIQGQAQPAIDEAVRLAIAKLDKRAEVARREYERLPVHALNVEREMRKAESLADRAKILMGGAA